MTPCSDRSTARSCVNQHPVVDNKCNEEQNGAPPVFERPIPPPNPNPQQAQGTQTSWSIELSSLFEDRATVRHEETGPELDIEVWYVHHSRMPICHAARHVTLDNIRELWYADLCMVWIDQIIRHQPLKVLIVRPTPTLEMRNRDSIHIILEQGMLPGLVALHFTAVFHGGIRTGILQKAESVPDRICTQDMVIKHDLQRFCEPRPCQMWMGSLRFLQNEAEDFFSGIAVRLEIEETATSSDGVPADQSSLPDYTMLMQRMPPPAASASENAQGCAGQSTSSSQQPPGPPARMQMPSSQTQYRVQNIVEFRQALQWQVDTQTMTCLPQQRRQPRVHSWFSDSVSLPRSDHFRDVLLSAHPAFWVDDILARWTDWILADHDLQLHLVQPHPSGGDADTVAHVIIVQRPRHDMRSALVTIVELLEDPWNPTSFCTLLPQHVSQQQLLTEADVTDRCVPLNPNTLCEVSHGSIQIEGDMTFPVRHGFNFELALSSLDTERDDTASLLQLVFAKVQVQIRQLDQLVHHATKTMPPSQGQPPVQNRPVEMAISPPHRAGNPVNSFDALNFLTTLQCHWQPLSIVPPVNADPFVPVMTWFVDHIRFPQWFLPRAVQLFADPEEWIHILRNAWRDVIRADVVIRFALVQPHPIAMEPGVAAHIIITQQPIEDFRSVLISTVDSAWPGQPPLRHATMAPRMLPCSTIIALAYRDRDCNLPRNVCSVWIGEREVAPHEVLPVFHGQSITVAIHRQVIPANDEPDPWEFDVPRAQKAQKKHNAWPFLQTGIDQICDDDFRFAIQHLHRSLLHTPESPPPGKFQPIVISIDAALPNSDDCCKALEDDVSVIAWFQFEQWHREFQSSGPMSPHPLPDGLRIPDDSYFALLQPALDSDPAHWIWEIYVDGSQGSIQAGWSVIVTCTDYCRSCFCGCFAGKVQLSPMQPDWYGAIESDNIAAELTAFIVAQDVAYRLLPGKQVVIRPDLMLSQMIATFDTITKASPHLAQICRVLSRWLGRRVQVNQVSAHKGHPWNELADCLAKWAANAEEVSQVRWHAPGLHALASAPHDLHWCWLQDAPEGLQICFPPLIEGEVMKFTDSSRRIAEGPRPAQRPLEWLTVAFQCASANVLALDHFEHQNEVGRQTGARTARLDQQLHQRKVAVVGVQEARTKQGRYNSEHFAIFASGFQGPRPVCLGCELWIHHALPIATLSDGTQFSLKHFSVTTQWADPRRLFVRLESAQLVLQFVVLHAPCLSKNKGDGQRPIDAIAAWWKETANLCCSHIHTDLVWVFADANAPLNQDFAPFTGAAGAEPMNPQGRLLGEFLSDMQLYVPTTFEHFHSGLHKTWTHSQGSKYRRDYIFTSPKAFELVQSSWVLHDFDTTFCHDDHLPVCMKSQGFLQLQVQLDHPILWDEHAFLCPHRTHAFRTALATLPLPTWDVAIEDHQASYEQQLLQLGVHFFARRTKTKQRPTLSRATLEKIAMKRHLLDCARAWGLAQTSSFKELIRPVEKEVRRAVRHDLTVFYDQLLVQLQTAGSLGDQKTVFRTLTRLGGRNRKSTGSVRPLPMLRTAEGSLTTTFLERQQVWMDQFADIEAGTVVPKDALRKADLDRVCRVIDLQQPDSFPTVWDIQEGLRKLKRGRAPGPNGIPPALLKAGGEVFARQFLALLTKCAAHSHEPLDWKGGRLFPLHKGKMHPAEPEGYRSIFVSDFTAKLYHMTMRRSLVTAWHGAIHSLQLGGRKGQGTDMAHHFLQTFLHWTTKTRKPAAIIFFDMKAAFYSVIRDSLFPGYGDLAQLGLKLQQLGITEAMAQHMAPSVDADFALQGLSHHMLAILHDVLTNTHFYIDGLHDPCRTRRGTRPDDPIGDILFNMVMSCLLKDAKECIVQSSSMEWYGSPEVCKDFSFFQALPAHGFFDISFVDDCAFGVHGTNLDQVEAAIKCVVNATVSAAQKRGLVLNFDAGKTEAIWNIVGKGSREKKAQLATAKGCLAWNAGGVQTDLRIVPAYKHLGTWLQIGNVHGKEVQHRSSLARATWGALSRQFYNKSYVSLSAKAQVFHATAISQFQYNAHVWTGLTPAEWERWHNALRKPVCLMIRGKLRGINPLHIDMDAACSLAGILPPRHALQVSRLRYLKRLTQHCPTALWNLLMTDAEQNSSWISECQDALAWFRKHYDVPFALETDTLTDWLPLIALDASWKGRVRRAAHSCLQFCAAIAERQLFHLRFSKKFEDAGGILPVDTKPQTETWQCDLCPKCFPSKKGLAAHAARVHGYKRIEFFFAADATCDACGKFYHVRARLLSHLYDCPDCLATLQACFPPLPEVEVARLDAVDKQYAIDMRQSGWWRTKAFAPPLKVQGPLLPPQNTEDAKAFRAKWEQRNVHPGSSFQELQGRCAQPEPSGAPEVKLFAQDLPAFVMQSPPGPNRGHGLLDRVGLARETARLHIKWLVFVHFYSGYRRANDLHAVIEQTALPDGAQILVISVDLCMQRKDGNLATAQASAWWTDRVRSGQLIGAGGGPPCESYTAARFLDGGPRPLRTGTYPDGLPALNAKEWQQLRIGSRLVYFIFELLLEIATCGGCGFIEHPQWPLWAAKHDPSSIWATLPARLCRTLSCYSVVSFDQCVVGAPAVKPTTLLLLRLDSFRHHMLRSGRGGRCPHLPGTHVRLQGCNDEGEFRTAVGKNYPAGLNQALGKAICRFAAETLDCKLLHQTLPNELQCYTHQIFEDHETVQPDFHGT